MKHERRRGYPRDRYPTVPLVIQSLSERRVVCLECGMPLELRVSWEPAKRAA